MSSSFGTEAGSIVALPRNAFLLHVVSSCALGHARAVPKRLLSLAFEMM